eukprot:Nitzschia sp. Nitz4//scaffold22_size323478//171849//173432//NITZ4_000543-RA/size323478-processed-gene-0.467-mRNA-1//-1//CDS//3329543043//6694//frame0
MLFPAVYELGFKAGETIHGLWHQSIVLPSSGEAIVLVSSFPGLYRDWWLNLVMNDPLHVAVETTLLLSLLYMVFFRLGKDNYKNPSKEKLSSAEKEDLLAEWKQTRVPLAPSSDSSDGDGESAQVVIQSQDGKYMNITYQGEDTVLKVLNFCNFDFLGLQTSPRLKQVSEQALNRYGCGSCGPRGFYGTIDTHLQLEEAISKFTKTDGAIMYSDGASTCSSTVAAFAKRGDILVVDEAVYEPITTGVYLSRANVHWFKHNDMDDLERILKELQQEDKRLGRKPNAQRRFIVVEGLYKNLGTIAPLDQIVHLKHKYRYRLILDESFSFGTLGRTGRGALEHYHQRPMYDAEIITIALENSLGSVGGVTVGNEEVVDHQRLSGAGYCFSASSPPFMASAAVEALRLMDSSSSQVSKLQKNVTYMYERLASASLSHLVVTSDERSPIVVLQLYKESPHEAEVMSAIMHDCLKKGVAFVATGKDASSHLRTELAPAIRMTVSTLHTKEDIDLAVSTLDESSKTVVGKFPID